MNVDLSRSIDESLRKTLQRADGLRASGQAGRAAAVYREAAGLARAYAQYAVSPAERSRRTEQASNLRSLAQRLLEEGPGPASGPVPQGDGGNQELRPQIEALIMRSSVGWEDIGGLDQTKRQIQLAFGLAFAARPLGVRIEPIRNILLYGPPGTGKSLLAAAASRGLGAAFFNVNAAAVLSKWFGESARLIATLYSVARQRAPSLVFIDELDALFASREVSSGAAERQVLATLLAELSGVAAGEGGPPVFTLGATNTPWLMDPAALSRFGRRVYVPLPDAAARRQVLEIHLTRRGHVLNFPLEDLLTRTEGLSGRQLAHLAAAAVEAMIADANPSLVERVARGSGGLGKYRLATRPLRWGDFEPALACLRPDTPPEALERFESLCAK
jgi:SpoVK/Ycf46/Vps4 family AAA+-type ATPase